MINNYYYNWSYCVINTGQPFFIDMLMNIHCRKFHLNLFAEPARTYTHSSLQEFKKIELGLACWSRVTKCKNKVLTKFNLFSEKKVAIFSSQNSWKIILFIGFWCSNIESISIGFVHQERLFPSLIMLWCIVRYLRIKKLKKIRLSEYCH